MLRSPSPGRALALFLLASSTSCSTPAPPRPGELTLSVPYELSTLDPHMEDTASAYALLGHFYEGLVATDAEMRIVPALAVRWETPDERSWVFHLRPGATFADGRSVEAADVVFSLGRLKSGAGLEVAGYAAHVDGVEELDRQTVKIHTARPLSVMLNKLAFISIVPRGSEAASLKERPNGTGPYILTQWEGGLLRLERRPGYWGPPPAFPRVTFRLGRSPEDSADDLVAGRSQLVQCSSRRASATVEAAGRFAIEARSSMFVKYLGFNVGREQLADGGPNPFRSPLVREAIELALDRDQIVRDLPREAEPATQYVPATIFGFDPTLRRPARDIARARALLAQAGFASGLRAPVVSRQILADGASLVRDQLREAGIVLELEVVDDSRFFARARTGLLVAHLSRFGCPTGDASDLFDNALHSRDDARGMGRINYSEYSSPEADRLMDASAAVDGVGPRQAALQAAMRHVLADRPWIPLYVDRETFAFERGIAWKPRNDGYLRAADVGWKE